MCVMSMVGDHYSDKWKWIEPQLIPYPAHNPPFVINPTVTREEFDSLKREVAEMVALMKRAKLYDEANGEPDCEMEDKLKLLRAVAKAVGVSLDEALATTARGEEVRP